MADVDRLAPGHRDIDTQFYRQIFNFLVFVKKYLCFTHVKFYRLNKNCLYFFFNSRIIKIHGSVIYTYVVYDNNNHNNNVAYNHNNDKIIFLNVSFNYIFKHGFALLYFI